MTQKQHRRICLVLFGFVISVMFISFQTQPVKANVPSIVNLTPWTSGTHKTLNITITHSSPTPSHYITIVQLDYLNGTTKDLNQPTFQSTTTFVVQCDMGEVDGTFSVRARAFCNQHGWSSWSNSVVVPEYPSFMLILVFAFATLLAVVKFRTAVQNNKER